MARVQAKKDYRNKYAALLFLISLYLRLNVSVQPVALQRKDLDGLR